MGAMPTVIQKSMSSPYCGGATSNNQPIQRSTSVLIFYRAYGDEEGEVEIHPREKIGQNI